MSIDILHMTISITDSTIPRVIRTIHPAPSPSPPARPGQRSPTCVRRVPALRAALPGGRPVQQRRLLIRRGLGAARRRRVVRRTAHHLSTAQAHLAVRWRQQSYRVVQAAGVRAAKRAAATAAAAAAAPPRRVRLWPRAVASPGRRRRRRSVRLDTAVGHQRGVQKLLSLRVGPSLRLLQDGLFLLGAAVSGVAGVARERGAAAELACGDGQGGSQWWAWCTTPGRRYSGGSSDIEQSW